MIDEDYIDVREGRKVTSAVLDGRVIARYPDVLRVEAGADFWVGQEAFEVASVEAGASERHLVVKLNRRQHCERTTGIEEDDCA